MKKEVKKVKVYKEIVNEDGKTERIYKTVTEKQANFINHMGGAALFMEEIAKFYEKELEKTACKDCRETLSWLIDEHYKLATDLVLAMDKFTFLCDMDLELAEHIQMNG